MNYYPDPDKAYKALLELELDETELHEQEDTYEYCGDEREGTSDVKE